MFTSVRWRTEGPPESNGHDEGPASLSRLQPRVRARFHPCASERAGAPEKRVLACRDLVSPALAASGDPVQWCPQHDKVRSTFIVRQALSCSSIHHLAETRSPNCPVPMTSRLNSAATTRSITNCDDGSTPSSNARVMASATARGPSVADRATTSQPYTCCQPTSALCSAAAREQVDELQLCRPWWRQPD